MDVTKVPKFSSTEEECQFWKSKYEELLKALKDSDNKEDIIPTQTTTPKINTEYVSDSERPSTSKKLASELGRTKRFRKRRKDSKLSKDDESARRNVLGASSTDEDEKMLVSLVKSKRNVARPRKHQNQKSRVMTEDDIAADIKLGKDDAHVKLISLAAEIEDELKREKFIIYDREGKSTDSSDDDENEPDDIRKLNRAIKELENYNAVMSRDSIRHRGPSSSSPLKKKKQLKPLDEVEASKQNASNEIDEKMASSPGDLDLNSDKERPMIYVKDMKSIIETDDLSDVEDLPNVNKKRKSSSNKSENQESKIENAKSSDKNSKSKKKYASTRIDLSDVDVSDTADRQDVLGKDSDDSNSDGIKERKTKKIDESSDHDDDLPIRKTRQTKKLTVKSDSDSASEAKNKSDSENSSVSTSMDSDSDSDFKTKKKPKKKKRSSSENEEEKKKDNNKKRRRIKEERDSDDSDIGSDVAEVEADNIPNSQKRKEIRKIMSQKDLKKSTRQAEKDEEERKKRVIEKQKLFNGVFETSELLDGSVSRLILDIDPETKEPLIEVDPTVVEQLKPHQVQGIKFMYTTCFESVEMIKKGTGGGGCILAHCMGLGKTLQTIAFTHTVMDHKKLTKVNRVLVVCPLNTVNNWFKEYQKWLQDVDTERKPRLHALWDSKNLNQRVDALKVWEKRGGVGIIHYDCFRLLALSIEGKGKNRPKPSHREVIERVLLDPGPDLIVCDEGHLLKNHKSKLSKALSKIKTTRRVVLTGTPLQNNLQEYHTMVNFVKPNLLGSVIEFKNRFINPIKNGQCKDSSEHDVKIMKRRAHVLHSKLDGCVQRLDYSVLTPYLPPKHEYCIIIKLSEKQKALYRDYLDKEVSTDSTERGRHILRHYAVLIKILAHPIVLTMKKPDKFDDDDDEDAGSLDDFIDDKEEETEEETEATGSDSDGEWLKANKAKKTKKKLRSCVNPSDDDNSNNSIPAKGPSLGNAWWCSHFESKDEMYDTELSGKLVVLQEILKTCENIGDKVLVFSQYLTTLNIIETFLEEWDQAAVKQQGEEGKQKTFPPTLVDSLGRWRPGLEYFRIDGQTKTDDRQKHCDIFNKKTTSSRAKLFLISTKAGGLGINLFGANRVVIFDASWNPSNDMQSIFRVYRFGQIKPCYIYRFVAQATMEEKIYNRQVVKLSLSSRVVDEHQVERHFKFDDINEMYKFDPDEKVERPTPPVPKDRLLADLLISHKSWIDSYFEHDTLLQNKEDETLTEAERKQAWDEYQHENERRVAPQMNQQDYSTLMKIKIKLFQKFPSATQSQVDESAAIVLRRIHELRNLIQKLHFEETKLAPEGVLELKGRIKRLEDWIAQSIGVQDGHTLENVAPRNAVRTSVLNGLYPQPPQLSPAEMDAQRLLMFQLAQQIRNGQVQPSLANGNGRAGPASRNFRNPLYSNAALLANANALARVGQLPPVPNLQPFVNANGGTAEDPLEIDD